MDKTIRRREKKEFVDAFNSNERLIDLIDEHELIKTVEQRLSSPFKSIKVDLDEL